MKKKYAFLILLTLILNSCTKEEFEYYDVTTSELKDDNQISSSLKENYIHKLFIDVLGRKPDNSEFEKYLSIIYINSGTTGRLQVIDSLLSTSEYFNKIYNTAKSEYLNGIDESELQRARNTYFDIYQLSIQQGNKVMELFYENEYKKIDSVMAIPGDLKAGKINEKLMYKRIVSNAVYDEINMGVANFTFAVFESFLFRAPTENEWTESQKMCNSQGAYLFGMSGKTKNDFVSIVFDSDHYYEGQVIAWFLKFMQRQPNSVELYEKTKFLKETNNYKSLYRAILSTDEYFGIK